MWATRCEKKKKNTYRHKVRFSRGHTGGHTITYWWLHEIAVQQHMGSPDADQACTVKLPGRCADAGYAPSINATSWMLISACIVCFVNESNLPARSRRTVRTP